MEKSSFAALPPELRARVYQHLFPKDQVYHIFQYCPKITQNCDAWPEGTEKKYPLKLSCTVCSSFTVAGGDSCKCGSSAFEKSSSPFRRTAFEFLLTCRQLYYECRGVAYGNSIFAFHGRRSESIDNVIAFLKSIGPRSLSHVRHVQLEIQGRNSRPGKAHKTMYPMESVLTAPQDFKYLLSQSQVQYLRLRVHLRSNVTFHVSAWPFVMEMAELNLKTDFIKNLDITFETPHATFYTAPYWPGHSLPECGSSSSTTCYQDRRISTRYLPQMILPTARLTYIDSSTLGQR